jgi:hypothetical protein
VESVGVHRRRWRPRLAIPWRIAAAQSPSGSPAELMRAAVQGRAEQAFYCVRSEHQPMEQIDYNLLFR